MAFKMSSKDFEIFAKYIDKRAKGSDIIFHEDHQKLIAKFTNAIGEQIEVSFYSEEIGSFAKLSKSCLLSEEL